MQAAAKMIRDKNGVLIAIEDRVKTPSGPGKVTARYGWVWVDLDSGEQKAFRGKQIELINGHDKLYGGDWPEDH